MKKTKLTLIISSLIMVLALVVTIVSVSAAWFSNTASTKIDRPLEIDSSTVKEYITIDVTTSALGSGGTAIWPAKAKKGAVLANDTNELPRGSALKTAGGIIGTEAQIAKQYIPIMFVGQPDTGKTHKSLNLKLESVSFGAYIQKDDKGDPILDEAGKPQITKDFRAEFNVEFDIVAVTTDENGKVLTETIIASETDPDNLSSSGIYYSQAHSDGTQGIDGSQGDIIFNMKLIPGTTYYVRAFIYYNKIDEECNPELLMEYQTIYFNFTLNMGNVTV